MMFGDLLVTGATWALVLAVAWGVLVLASALLEVASDGRLALTARVGCPQGVRRLLLTGLGVLLAGGGAIVTGPASATPPPRDPGRPGQEPGRAVTLPVPARPTGTAPEAPRQRIEVQPGDSLWALSQQGAPSASAPEVARLVERTYRDNRRTIGPDPDLIRPGQRLVVPRQPQPAPPQPGTRWETP